MNRRLLIGRDTDGLVTDFPNLVPDSSPGSCPACFVKDLGRFPRLRGVPVSDDVDTLGTSLCVQFVDRWGRKLFLFSKETPQSHGRTLRKLPPVF